MISFQIYSTFIKKSSFLYKKHRKLKKNDKKPEKVLTVLWISGIIFLDHEESRKAESEGQKDISN